jgi:hypothetical protein
VTISDWINVVATLVTLCAMFYTIATSFKVDRVRKAIWKKYRKLSVMEVQSELENIVRLGNELRPKLATGGERGQVITVLTHPLRSALSGAVGRLPPNSTNDNLRKLVLSAVANLTSVEKGTKSTLQENYEKFMADITDAVATCRGEFQDADSKELDRGD